jgi:predicted TIM-barrel fold metal-dependent hydrolase
MGPLISRREMLLGTLALAALRPAPSYRIIDPHVHVWINDPRYPWAKETIAPPKKNAAPEMLLALMKANNVARTVLVQVIYYRWDNRYIADVLKQYPTYFLGVCRVNPESPRAPDDLSQLVEQGFRGVRISPAADASGDWINGDLMPSLWRRTQQLKVPMQVYTSITRIPDVGKLIAKFPELDVIIDHMADCPVDQPRELDKLLALARYPRVFVKISHTWSISKQPYPWLDAQEHVKRLYAAYGPDRLMWGTDWPVCEAKTVYSKTLSVVRNDMKFLNDEDKSWILSRTMQKIWRFD